MTTNRLDIPRDGTSASLLTNSQTSAEKLLTPVRYDFRAKWGRLNVQELLKNLGITTAQDLLFHVPHAAE
ncbi:MAG: hypothetical protein U0936_03620 [Planctomycetaceae bacterium]